MTAAIALPVTAALTALLHELAEEIPDALSTPFTFATLWADLARLVGEPLPADVATVLDAPVPLAPPVPAAAIRRGSYADHQSQFPELYAIPRGDQTITQILARCPHPTRR